VRRLIARGALVSTAVLLTACGQPALSAPASSASGTPAVSVHAPRLHDTDFQAGAMVLVYGNDPEFAAKSATLLDHLARLGVNSVGFVFPIFQRGPTATNVYPDKVSTPTDANVTAFLKAAHRRGLTVMMRPLLDEQSAALSGHWRGNINPPNRAAWWQSYDGIVLRYARLAQAGGASIFDVGTEMTTMEADTAQWATLIAAVHGVFAGQITYSTNWDRPLPAFGRSLSFLSVDAWFPLAVPKGADPIPTLINAWKPWLVGLEQQRATIGRPLVFTELGLASQQGALERPWAHLPNLPQDLQSQRQYYAATCQAVKGAVAGMYWWDFELTPPAPGNTGFPPAGKPAEDEIARCYAQLPVANAN